MDIEKIYYERLRLEKEYIPRKLVERPQPLVSVCVITYQHKNFIKQCIDGILMQQTSFPIEIIIGEDESTDGTREICIEYAEKYPEQIRLFLRNRKTSQLYDGKGRYICRFNGKWNREFANGKYIALCEGDDYWTDPYKLQKQVEFLEENPDFSACFTNAKILVEETGKEEAFVMEEGDRHYTMNDIIEKGGGLFPTASLVFRNRQEQYPAFLISAKSGDRALSLYIANTGSFSYFDTITCVYRRHVGGIFSGIQNNIKERILILQDNIHLLEKFDIYTRRKYNSTFRRTISHMALKILLSSTYKVSNVHFSTMYKKLVFKHKISYFKNRVVGVRSFSELK